MFNPRKARELFERFHDRAPKAGEIVCLKDCKGEVVLRVGELLGVIYKTDKDQYIHEFKADRPGLYVSSDGQQAYIVAGRYVFTDRGFID